MDHLVYACRDLAMAVDRVEALLGVTTSEGGRHLGLGTRNRLIGLGPDSYLEVVGVDPEQPAPARARWFGLDDLAEPRLVSWAVKATDLAQTTERGRRAGIDLGATVEGGRERPDGTPLRWRFTDPWAARAGGVIPFLIDWGDSAHPAASLPPLCACEAIRAQHPDPVAVAGWLEAIGVSLPVSKGAAPGLVATLTSPNGLVELR